MKNSSGAASCFSSSSPMENMRDSTVVPQIVKIVRMIIKFHPSLTVTSLICQVIFLQYWIEEEVSNQWKVFKVFCQSTMAAVLDLISEKMKNLSKAFQMHLDNEAAKGQSKAKLIGKLALSSATFLLLDTEFSSKYDKRGAKMQLLLLIGLHMLTHPKLWSHLKIFYGRYFCAANSTLNFTFFILAIVFAKFYDNSLRTISAVLFIAIFFLCLLVVLRPRTDLGLFNFIMGIIGSITYNRFKFRFVSWIIASICFMLFSFKSWLDKYWLDSEQDNSTNITAGSTGTNVILALSSATIHIAQPFFASCTVKSPLSDYKDSLVRAIGSWIWILRLHKFYPKEISLPSTKNKGIDDLILTTINVAQGMFAFAFSISPVADYKWLFIVISYVVFCFWLRRFLLKDLSLPSTNTKGITGMILALQSIATCDVVVFSGLEPGLYFSEWLVGVACYMLWWVRLHILISQSSLTIHDS